MVQRAEALATNMLIISGLHCTNTLLTLLLTVNFDFFYFKTTQVYKRNSYLPITWQYYNTPENVSRTFLNNSVSLVGGEYLLLSIKYLVIKIN